MFGLEELSDRSGVKLRGDLTVGVVAELERRLRDLAPVVSSEFRWDLREVTHIDTAAALVLWDAWSGALPPRLNLPERSRDLFGRLADMDGAALDLVHGRPERQAAETLDELPALVRQFSASLEEFRLATRALNERTSGLDELLEAMRQASENLNEVLLAIRGDTLVDVDETLLSLRIALGELAELADTLRRDPQSLLLGPGTLEPGPGEKLEPLE